MARHSRNIHPRLPTRRILDRLDQGLHARSGAKVERPRPFPGKAIEKAGDLDGLQIVEAELMTGRNAEKAIGIVIRSGLDATKAAAPGGVCRAEEGQLVE